MRKSLRTTVLAAAAVGALFMATPAEAAVFSDQAYTVSGNALPMNRLTVSDITLIQQKLADSDFYAGPVDGHWGPRTTNAVRTFQSSNDLPPTGKVTKDTLEELGLSINAMYGQPVNANAGNMPDFEPAAMTSGAYTQTNTYYTTRSGRSFLSSDFDAQNSTCRECTDGIYGNGGRPDSIDD